MPTCDEYLRDGASLAEWMLYSKAHNANEARVAALLAAGHHACLVDTEQSFPRFTVWCGHTPCLGIKPMRSGVVNDLALRDMMRRRIDIERDYSRPWEQQRICY